MFAFLIFATETPPFGAHADKAAQIERTAQVFSGAGWRVPQLIEAMRHADDLFFDTVSQIRMPQWTKGRVALLGDAAYAPSFRSGQGSSMAMVGAYVLAGELASHDDPAEALVAYETALRPYIQANQALANRQGANFIFPRTQAQLDERNRMLAALQAGPAADKDVRGEEAETAYNMLTLRDYPAA